MEHGLNTDEIQDLVSQIFDLNFYPCLIRVPSVAKFCCHRPHFPADDSGVTVEQALDAIGYAGPAPVGQRAFDAYLELHIEQAPVLDREGCDIGIVGDWHQAVPLLHEALRRGATEHGATAVS